MKTVLEQQGGHLRTCGDNNSLHSSIAIRESSNSCDGYPEIEISSLRYTNSSMDSEDWRKLWDELYGES